jgi:uncharacterized protein YjiS (DUF1127 family)
MISKLILWFHRRSVYNQTFKELASMSDRDLYDLGITRGDISTLAYEATYGKTHK